MTTHISYETAKRLKEFLGESAPEPIDKYNEVRWCGNCGKDIGMGGALGPCGDGTIIYSYSLHDLLSKPFCEVMAKRLGTWHMGPKVGFYFGELLYNRYSNGDLHSVEAALIKMMGETK